MENANFLEEEITAAKKRIKRINYLQNKRKMQDITHLSTLYAKEKEIQEFIIYLKGLVSKGNISVLPVFYEFITSINKELSLRPSDPYFFDYKLNDALRLYENKLKLMTAFKEKGEEMILNG